MKQPLLSLVCAWLAMLAIWPALSISAPALWADVQDDRIRIVLQLDEEQCYAAADLARQLNVQLGAQYDLEPLEGVRQPILPAEKAALRLLAATIDRFEFDISGRELVLSFERHDSESARGILNSMVPRRLPMEADLYRLHISDADAQADRIVLLIHGLGSSPEDFENLSRGLRKLGLTVACYEYPGDGPPEYAARLLSIHLKKLAAERPGVQIDIIAHSLGGLIARRLVENADYDPGNIRRLLLMAVPHAGSNLALFRSMWEVARLVELEADLEGIGREFTGSPGSSLMPGSPFLSRLHSQERPADVEYHQLVGTKAPFTEEQWSALVERVRLRLIEHEASPWIQANVLGMLQSLDEVQTGRGDEAVTIASATLEGAPAPTHVSFSHREIQRLRQVEPVEDHPVFQWVIKRLSVPASSRPGELQHL